MSKAEQFIQDCTKTCSNEIEWSTEGFPSHDYALWVTPLQALRAVEIEREETTEKIKRLLKENYLIKSVEPLRWVSWEKVFNDIKQAMEE